jgi:hypothetical protein
MTAKVPPSRAPASEDVVCTPPHPQKRTHRKEVAKDNDMVQVYKDGSNTHKFSSGFNKGYNRWGYNL